MANKPSTPEMVSVPRELTPEMREAFHRSYMAYEEGRGESPDSQWRAMLRAAPKPAEQHQGEPVTLPDRKNEMMPFGYDASGQRDRGKVQGWNACLDEISKLGPLYTRPAPADPGEVERLRDILEHKESVQAELNQALEEVLNDRDTLRAQLAEVQELIQALTQPEYGLMPDVVLKIQRFTLSPSAEPTAKETLAAEKPLGIERLPSGRHVFKSGDIVRYADGSSALVKLDAPHAGGWHGIHCLGGYNFVSDITLASPEDVETYNTLRAKTLRQQGRSE